MKKNPNIDLIRERLRSELGGDYFPDRHLVITHGALYGHMDIYLFGPTSSGPLISLADLRKVKDTLLGLDPDMEGAMMVDAGERPDDGWTYIRLSVATEYLLDEVCIQE